ncbi:glycosyltransferase family A protein [Desulfobacterales bacterium HSG16]|nr:glycosyltransferase family A protein [Desulfobacterales bacterium HSG16]
MSTRHDAITVLTVTRHRPQLLKRAMLSVKKQDYDAKIQHIICIDDCIDTYNMLKQQDITPDNLTFFLRARSESEQSGPGHLAKLRNLMGRMANLKWISFLDDDNEYEPFHLRLLMDCVQRTGCSAVHSWMQILNFDGSPYLEQCWPWCRDTQHGTRRYLELANRGLISPNSNVVRDGINNLPYRCIDTSEWLIERDLFLNHPIPTHFTHEDWINNKAEDDKLLEQLLSAKVTIACNNVVSLKYYLGGYSTNHDSCHQHSETWKWQQS